MIGSIFIMWLAHGASRLRLTTSNPLLFFWPGWRWPQWTWGKCQWCRWPRSWHRCWLQSLAKQRWNCAQQTVPWSGWQSPPKRQPSPLGSNLWLSVRTTGSAFAIQSSCDRCSRMMTLNLRLKSSCCTGYSVLWSTLKMCLLRTTFCPLKMMRTERKVISILHAMNSMVAPK